MYTKEMEESTIQQQESLEPKTEVLRPEQETRPELQTEETKPSDESVDKRDKKFVKVVFVVIMVIFIISSLSGALARFFGLEILGVGLYLWGVAAGASFLFFLAFLFSGAITFNRGGAGFMAHAILFFIIALLVGLGTCLINLQF